jgi:hypothetical protein
VWWDLRKFPGACCKHTDFKDDQRKKTNKLAVKWDFIIFYLCSPNDIGISSFGASNDWVSVSTII